MSATKPTAGKQAYVIKLWDRNETCVWTETIVAKYEAYAIQLAKQHFIATVAGTSEKPELFVESDVRRPRCTERMTLLSDGTSIKTWRNNEAKAWVVQVKDPAGTQIGTHDFSEGGESSYEYRGSFAKLVHQRAVDELLKRGAK